MTRFEIRNSTADDFLSFYGYLPKVRTRALSCCVDGKILGIAGLQYQKLGIVAFSDINKEIRKYKKFILKASKALVELVEKEDRPVYAVAEFDTSPALLAHLGFEPVTEEVYLWPN